MARDKNTYAKRQRESLKRQKTQEKNERRRVRKERGDDTATPVVPSDGNQGQGDTLTL
jgi:hypothetical protein